jgi:hypothetical protein
MRKLTAKSASILLVLLIILVLSASIFMSEIFASNSEDTATTNIERAENALVSAYQAVLEVEQVGADVSGLLAELNEAGEFLAEARMAYRLGDFDNAISSADMGRDIGEGVEVKAYELRDSEWRENIQRMWLTIMGSVLGVIMIASGSFWVWRFLKRRYP